MSISFKYPPVGASICVVVAVSILWTLSWWQWQRLAWKEQLLADMQLELAQESADDQLSVQDIERFQQDGGFERGSVSGAWLSSLTIAVGPRQGQQGGFGYQIHTPLKMDDNAIILVDRGWVHLERKDEAVKALRQQDASVDEVEGFLKKVSGETWITKLSGLKNVAHNDVWQVVDVKQIAAHFDRPIVNDVVFVSETPVEGLQAFDVSVMRLPNNNHLYYALFWASMGLVLLGVFVLRFMLTVSRTDSAAQ